MVKKTENELNFSHKLNFVQFYHLFLPLNIRFLPIFLFYVKNKDSEIVLCQYVYLLFSNSQATFLKH